jgi:hypothetical protein
VGGGGDHIQIGVRSQQPEQFAASVSARSGDSDSISHGNYYALLRK